MHINMQSRTFVQDAVAVQLAIAATANTLFAREF